MRKPFLIAGIAAILIGAGAIYWSQFIMPATIFSANEEVRPIVILNPPEADEESQEILRPAQDDKKSFPKYTGQPLGYLGDPKILANGPADFIEIQRERLMNNIAILNEDPVSISALINIGIIKKQAGNYIGARDAWEYARVLYPDNSLNLINLANLYSGYLGELEKAEENYLRAVELDPHSVNPYLKLAEFYKYFYPLKFEFVDDVLFEGLKNLPDEPNMLLMLAAYYRDKNEAESAIKYFERFLKTAPDVTGAQQEAIKREIEKLKA